MIWDYYGYLLFGKFCLLFCIALLFVSCWFLVGVNSVVMVIFYIVL